MKSKRRGTDPASLTKFIDSSSPWSDLYASVRANQSHPPGPLQTPIRRPSTASYPHSRLKNSSHTVNGGELHSRLWVSTTENAQGATKAKTLEPAMLLAMDKHVSLEGPNPVTVLLPEVDKNAASVEDLAPKMDRDPEMKDTPAIGSAMVVPQHLAGSGGFVQGPTLVPLKPPLHLLEKNPNVLNSRERRELARYELAREKGDHTLMSQARAEARLKSIVEHHHPYGILGVQPLPKKQAPPSFEAYKAVRRAAYQRCFNSTASETLLKPSLTGSDSAPPPHRPKRRLVSNPASTDTLRIEEPAPYSYETNEKTEARRARIRQNETMGRHFNIVTGLPITDIPPPHPHPQRFTHPSMMN